MPRSHARVNITIWQDADFRELPPPAQHLYFVLWTHPALSYCGVLDWRPGRIAALAGGWEPTDVLEAADCLEARLFIVTDPESEECLIRSWAKHDGLLREAKMSVSWAIAYAAVASPLLRGVIVHEAHRLRRAHPEYTGWTRQQVLGVLDQPPLDPAERDLPADLFRGGLRGGFRGGVRGPVSPPLGVDLGSATPNGTPWVKGSVKGSPTPSPAPTPLLRLQHSSPSTSTSPGEDVWEDER